MAIKFYKLMNLLNIRRLTQKQVAEMANISPKAMSKLATNKKVSLDVVDKVCDALDVQPSDMMEFVREDKE